MYPILLQWNSFTVPAWHVLFVLGAFAAYVLLLVLASKFLPSVSERSLGLLFVLGYVGGYLGARLLSIFIEEQPQTFGAVIAGLGHLGAMTMYGGVAGCFLLAFLYACRANLPVAAVADIAVLAGIFAVGIGRVGCFLNGDDYGLPVDALVTPWWAVTFPNHSNPLPRYPVQLIEAAFCWLWISLLIGFFRSLRDRFYPGFIASVGLAGYGIFRFIIEFWRGDERGAFIAGFSPSQLISIAVLMVVAAVTLVLSKQRRQSPKP